VEITRELLEERLARYQADRSDLQAQLNAYEGAVQDCQHWLSVLDQEPEEESEE